uniref:Uncharacterized protein n=1 Tax=Myxococcus xanthus TaxID=34 RepID=A0A7U3MXV7_MYXXA|nr:hypothetical protein [Myxococcus xanthus]
MKPSAVVRSRMRHILVPGLVLGLPFAGLMVGDTSEASQEPLPESSRCKCFHREVKIQLDANGLHFAPDHCLSKGGTVRFLNACQTEVVIQVDGPEIEPPLSLLPEMEGDMPLIVVGTYTVTAVEGCPELPDDSRTGTLEVGTDPGPGGKVCQ